MRKPSGCVAGRVCLYFGLVAAMSIISPAAFAQRVQGFDVSQFQGNINWTTAYNAGVRFAFIRATRGGPMGAQHTDLNVHQNMAGSSSVPIYTGNYHFGRPDTMVFPPNPTVDQLIETIVTHSNSEADFFYNTITPYLTPGHLRPVLDLEVAGSSTPTGRAILSFWANSFLDRFESRSGVEPLMYMNTNYATSFYDASIAHRLAAVRRLMAG